MNDRYLFKGYNITLKKWLLGYLYIDNFTKKNYILENYDNIQYSDMLPNGIEVINVCQCTGPKDKNGKLIFEGDIIHFCDYKTAVHWEEHFVCFDCVNKGLMIPFNGAQAYKYEIIGNIHDNPDLLEADNA